MKNIVMLMGAFLFSSMLSAQVKFNLTYAEATKVYTLSIIPQATWEAPKNIVASAQIVLRVDAGSDFVPGITSLVPGATWADNAYVEQPASAPDYTFVCIALISGPTSAIPLVAGQEVPLFSFVNVGQGCAGSITMLTNDDPMVQAVINNRFNVTQNLAVLGLRGNAFTGLENSTVECASLSGVGAPASKLIDDVKISPLPADKAVNIEWSLLSDQPGLRQMVICDVAGREILREKISDGKGQHKMNIPVANWKAGMYRVHFVLENDRHTQSWNMMVIH